ncbi:TonB-dependent hemoglobin/transferrin/lactoferrin family receptor [Marinicella meishanensis]|uniref:TonB-dependent hemoglobin/transferrin/lactoferrin family receptor n=1 Tax=Marinicella meishanensis TaxID=2873263 RepID=UPI001CBBB003|nr:TonB-dependent hemoglobin/transferrin/lactoferrin family receptor [Marinicella sp. NBU2979]
MKKFVTCTALAMGIVTALQEVRAEEDESLELEKVTVTANRTSKTLDELSNKASVITAEEIDKYLHQDIRDLVRYEPGVTVSGLGRFGLSGFNIRGIGGDRVLTLVDGAPIADEFSFGPALSARRNYIDVDALKAVEIVRGPASSLYGSNAIGGLVTFITKDPSDYYQGSDDQQYVSIKSGWDSSDASFDHTFTYAGGGDRFQGMVVGTHRHGEATQSYFTADRSTGANRMSANPIDNTEVNWLGKMVFQASADHTFKFTAEKYQADVDTSVLTQAGSVVFGTVKLSVDAKDSRDRNRFSFEYLGTPSTAMFDEVNVNVYFQNSDSAQNTFEERLSPAQVRQTRTRNSFYEQDNRGFKVSFIKDIDTPVGQQWVYGIDYDFSDIQTLRAGQTIATQTGEIIPETSNFPTRDFPNSEYQSLGLFVQNELSFLGGRLSIIPSLRWDDFKLTPIVDDIYLSGNSGSPTPAAYSESELSSKLGFIHRFTDQWAVFGQYAEGFKAPPIDAVNTGFTNFAGGYTTLPNPDLNPESSKTTELGLRFKGEQHQVELSFYRSRYEDFIESLAFRGFNPTTGLLEFQARNLDEAEIVGFELRGHLDLANFHEGMHLQYAYAHSDGEDDTTGLPINTVQPESLVVGLGYDAPSGRWGSELIMTVNDRKTDIDDSAIQPADPADPAVPAFNTPGFSTYDWVGYYNLRDNLRVNWGIFNLTDKQYWQWNDVLLQPAGAANLARLTQPGRNASLTVRYEF